VGPMMGCPPQRDRPGDIDLSEVGGGGDGGQGWVARAALFRVGG